MSWWLTTRGHLTWLRWWRSCAPYRPRMKTVDIIFQVLTKAGKRPVIVQKEVPGFIANRLMAALLRESLSMVQRGIASPEDIDTVIKTSHARRWVAAGIFGHVEVGAGWDLLLDGLQQLLPDIYSSLAVIELVQEKVDKGELGSKTGKGFYDWTPESPDVIRQEMAKAYIEIEKWGPSGRVRFWDSRLKPGCCSRNGAQSPPCPSPCRTPARGELSPGPTSSPPTPGPPPGGKTAL